MDRELRADVDAFRRLVDEKNRGANESSAREHDLLLVAARQRAHRITERASAHIGHARRTVSYFAFATVRDGAPRSDTAERWQRHVVTNGSRQNQPLGLSILGDQKKAGIHR